MVIAPLFTITKEANSVSFSVWNWAADKSYLQIGVINFTGFLMASGDAHTQIGIINEAGCSTLQIGLANNGCINPRLQLVLFNTVSPNKYTHGKGRWPELQIGLLNTASDGILIGLLSKNENAWGWKWCPFINF